MRNTLSAILDRPLPSDMSKCSSVTLRKWSALVPCGTITAVSELE
jgi:hypothetical protein